MHFDKIFASKLMHPRSPLWLSWYTLRGAEKVFRAVRNPLKAFMFWLGFFNECTLNLKYLGKIKVERDDLKSNFLQALVSACSRDLSFEQRKKLYNIIAQKDNDMIEVGDVKIKNVIPLFILLEIFVLEDYKFTKLKQGDVILDIGASIADSSLYLAREGYTVYAFEPNPEIYKIGEENLKLNPHLARKIHYINQSNIYQKRKNQTRYNKRKPYGLPIYKR
ncbi:MAG: FkbM family methyltransferase [Methanothermobacter sp.]|nr:FkbM family methyltransferase [Methanothermobacter sp.]